MVCCQPLLAVGDGARVRGLVGTDGSLSEAPPVFHRRNAERPDSFRPSPARLRVVTSPRDLLPDHACRVATDK
jgi:hypothetical protein